MFIDLLWDILRRIESSNDIDYRSLVRPGEVYWVGQSVVLSANCVQEKEKGNPGRVCIQRN